jgi:predicted ATPase/DNA-binding winged helix-turn-helix (wHTH) protein
MLQGGEIAPPQATESDLCFGPFRLAGVKRLWCGERQVDVRPRPLAVLRYLAERPGRLVPGEELLKHLWPGIYVTKTVLRVCVREIRQALGEDPTAPRFLETVGRQGYRFAGTVNAQPSALGPSRPGTRQITSSPPPAPLTAQAPPQSTPYFVGREPELTRLQATFARARRGERQVVFVSGEAGIGKTTLVDRFLAQVQDSGPVRIGRGQCFEQHGPGEAYLALLEASGQLCSEPGGERVVAALRRYAPLWLARLPGLREPSGLDAGQRRGQDGSPARMMREWAEAIEVVAAEAVAVLVLEDLQWSDAATLEVVDYLAQRRGSARLQIIGTYRPTDVVLRRHRLRQLVQKLYGRRQCEELALELFSEAEVEEYLVRRFGPSPAMETISEAIHRYTDGNALFVVNFVDYLLERGLLSTGEGRIELRADRGTLRKLVPETLQQLITRQIEGLSEEERLLLGVASVAGRTFTAAEVAGVVGRRPEEVEEVYDRLASARCLIEAIGVAEWPEGKVTVRYGFGHALYREALYERVGPARRVRLHYQLGEWKEVGYGERSAEIAAELAVHFAEGRDYRRAVQYYCRAGETALRRSAYRELTDYCKEGLDLLERLPDTPERRRQELALRMTLHQAFTATQGSGNCSPPELEAQ